MKYNINSDSINIIKTIIGGTYSFFKEFNGKLYYAQKFYDSLIIDKLTFATSNTASDWDNILFCLDIKSYSIQKYYHFTGNDEESIHDFFVDRDNSLYVIGSFYGSSIIFNSALLKNSSSRSYDGFFFKIDSSNNVLVKKGIQGPYHQFPRTLDIGSNGQIYIYGNYNAQYIQVDQEKLFNNTKSYNIFSLHLDPSGSVQSLNQYNTSEYISAQSFIQHPTNKDLIFATGDYNDTLYVGNNNYLYTPNDNSDGVLLLMDKNCHPVDGFAISSNEIDAIQAITYNGLDNYTLWCYSREGSDTTKLINFDKKYLIKPGYFFMDVKIKKTVNTNEIPKNVYQFEVFPNPCIDYFTIKSNEEFKNVQITIYDMYGKIVYQEKFKKFVNSTSIKWPDNIVSGVYFIKLQASIVQQSMKIQKQ